MGCGIDVAAIQHVVDHERGEILIDSLSASPPDRMDHRCDFIIGPRCFRIGGAGGRVACGCG